MNGLGDLMHVRWEVGEQHGQYWAWCGVWTGSAIELAGAGVPVPAEMSRLANF